jgi:hypothetical protein
MNPLQNKWESRRIEHRFSAEIVPYSYTINSQQFECHCDICLIQLQWYICRCLSVGLWILHCWNIQISPPYLFDHRLTFRPLSPPHCIICPTSNYSIWLPICYIKTILSASINNIPTRHIFISFLFSFFNCLQRSLIYIYMKEGVNTISSYFTFFDIQYVQWIKHYYHYTLINLKSENLVYCYS